jgi:hypothetical protein
MGDFLLREADKRELIASTGMSAGKALTQSVTYPHTSSWIGYSDSLYPLAIFGHFSTPEVSGKGIWMVATKRIYKYIPEFKRFSDGILKCWLRKYGKLYSYIDTRNKVHMRWLDGLGFNLGNTLTLNGYTFQYFYKEND